MKTVNPYLNFDGQAEEAMYFYKSVFGGEFTGNRIMRVSDVPGGDEMKISAAEKNRVMHVSLPISGNILLMASDILPSMGHKLSVGNNNYISLAAESREEADFLFKGLSDGGEVEMPMQDQFWGDYFGSFKDKYGVCWMVNYSNTSE